MVATTWTYINQSDPPRTTCGVDNCCSGYEQTVMDFPPVPPIIQRPLPARKLTCCGWRRCLYEKVMRVVQALDMAQRWRA